jgi:hypothetical protein
MANLHVVSSSGNVARPFLPAFDPSEGPSLRAHQGLVTASGLAALAADRTLPAGERVAALRLAQGTVQLAASALLVWSDEVHFAGLDQCSAEGFSLAQAHEDFESAEVALRRIEAALLGLTPRLAKTWPAPAYAEAAG